MNPSVSSAPSVQKTFYETMRECLTTPPTKDLHSMDRYYGILLKKFREEYQEVIAELEGLGWCNYVQILSIYQMWGEKHLRPVLACIRKILLEERLTAEERRTVEPILAKHLRPEIREKEYEPICAIIDHAQKNVLRQLGGKVRGDIEHIYVPRRYGTLRGEVPVCSGLLRREWADPSEKPESFLYTDMWVLGHDGTPLFPFNAKYRETMGRTGAGYLGNGLFLVSQEKEDYHYSLRLVDENGTTLEQMKQAESLGNDLLRILGSTSEGREGGLYDLRTREWLLQEDAFVSVIRQSWIVTQNKRTGRFGVFDIDKRTWLMREKAYIGYCWVPFRSDRNIIPEWSGWVFSEGWAVTLVEENGENPVSLPRELESLFELDPSNIVLFRTGGKHFDFVLKVGKYPNTKNYLLASGTGEILPLNERKAWSLNEKIIIRLKEDEQNLPSLIIHLETGETTPVSNDGRQLRKITSHDIRGGDQYCFATMDASGFGLVDLFGHTLIAPQPYNIDDFSLEAGWMLVSRNAMNEDGSERSESCLQDLQGNEILPWDGSVSSVSTVRPGLIHVWWSGLLLEKLADGSYSSHSVTDGWTTIKPTDNPDIVVIETDYDRGGIWHVLYRISDRKAAHPNGTWSEFQPDRAYIHGVGTCRKLTDGSTIFGDGVLDKAGNSIVPGYFVPSTTAMPLQLSPKDSTGVMLRTNNAIMRVVWDRMAK